MTTKKAVETISRAKSWINDAISNAIHFQETLDAYLQRRGLLYDTEWYKALPHWAKAEVRGYEEAAHQFKMDALHLRCVHLFQGYLFTSYDNWRQAYPELPGSALSDSCVTVWKSSGKVHFASKDHFPMGSDTVVNGMTFPFYVPGETKLPPIPAGVLEHITR